MNRHLTPDEIAGWAIGERTADGEAHVGECAACRGEVERLAETFALFRNSGERWSEHWSRPESGRAGRQKTLLRPAVAGLAMAASVLAGALLLHGPAPKPVEAPFLEIPYTAPLAPYERASIVRTNVPVAALVAAGFDVHGAVPGDSVTADVLVGQDGRAHAFRLISNRSVLQ